MHTRTPLKSQDLSSSKNDSSKTKKIDQESSEENSKDATWEECKVPSKPKPKPKKTNVQANSMTGTQPSSQSSNTVKAPRKAQSPSAVITQPNAQPKAKTNNQGFTTISTQKVVNPQAQGQIRKCCGFCRKVLLQNQKIIQVQGYACHFTCFVCWNCKKQLGNGGYINRGRFFFCSLKCADEGVEKYKALQKKSNAGRNI